MGTGRPRHRKNNGDPKSGEKNSRRSRGMSRDEASSVSLGKIVTKWARKKPRRGGKRGEKLAEHVPFLKKTWPSSRKNSQKKKPRGKPNAENIRPKKGLLQRWKGRKGTIRIKGVVFMTDRAQGKSSVVRKKKWGDHRDAQGWE